MADQEEQAKKLMEEQAKRMGNLIAKCWSDEGFKKNLLADPAATMKAEGVKYGKGVLFRHSSQTD
jgi:hypothetical protein